MKSLFTLAFLTVFLSCIHAQEEDFQYNFPEQFPAKYDFSPKKEYAGMLEESAGEDVNPKEFSLYAESMCYGKKAMFTSGLVYLDWQELETYLNAVLFKILPDAYKGNPGIHVYPTRDPSVNAFAIHDGSLFVNVGLFEAMPDEASLAIALGHELTHYLNEDCKYGYIRDLKLSAQAVRKKADTQRAILIDNRKYNRRQEFVADSNGYVLAYNAGYEIKSARYVFSIFKRIDRKYSAMNEKKKKKKERE